MSFEFISTRVTNEKHYLEKEDLLFRKLLILYWLYVVSKIKNMINTEEITTDEQLKNTLVSSFHFITSCSTYNMRNFDECKKKLNKYIERHQTFFDKYFSRTSAVSKPAIFKLNDQFVKLSDYTDDNIRSYLRDFYVFLAIDSEKISEDYFISYLIRKLNDDKTFSERIHDYYIVCNEQFTHIFCESNCTIDYIELMNNSFSIPFQVISCFMFRSRIKDDTILPYTSHMYIVRNLFHDIYLELSNIKLQNTSIALHSFASFIAEELFFMVNPRGNMEDILKKYKLQNGSHLLVLNNLNDNKTDRESFVKKVTQLHRSEDMFKTLDIDAYLGKYSTNIIDCSHNNMQVSSIGYFITNSFIVFTDNFHKEWEFLLDKYNKLKSQNGGYKYKKNKSHKKQNRKFTNRKLTK